VRDEIVELGTRYGIVTPYTSYLATDGSERRDGIQMDGVRGNAQRVLRNAPGVMSATVEVTADSGRGAVSVAKESRKKREAEQVRDEKLSSGVKTVGNKTFIYDESGIWTDTEFKPESKLPEVKLKFASDEFFKLIASEKELAQFFALGEEVIVVWKGRVYRIEK
jgi:Ca-activated chloride channel family protein